MKKIKILAVALLLMAGFTACEKDSDELSGNQNVGGLISVDTKTLTYALGSLPTVQFPVNLSVSQGTVKTVSIDVYKQFFGALGTSQKVLYKTVSFPSTSQQEYLTFNVTYNDLIADLLVNGSPLPASDSGLSVGDYWTLSYVAKTSAGTAPLNVKTTKITAACISQLEGLYKRGSKFSTVTSIGDGAYRATYLPAFASTYWFEFTDVCGVLQITDWEFQGGNPITATGLTTMPTGFVTSAGNLTFEHANVAGVSWYVDLAWTLVKQP